MRRTRVIMGIVLVLAGPSVAILAMRIAVGDQARAQASLLAAVNHDTEARVAQEKKAVEAQVTAATRIAPLEAGLRARVDGATLLDMFDNEDWWRPYRVAFPVVRVVVDGRPLATRGPELGEAGDEVVRRARTETVASGVVRADARDLVVAAARLTGVRDRSAILVLGRPTAFEVAAPPPAIVSPALGQRMIPWALAGALCLGGLGLVISARRRSAPGSVPQVISHESTVKFGTPAIPRASATTVTPPARGPITDSNAFTIPGHQTPPMRTAVTPQRAIEVGSSFGRYRLIDRLGEGGMSEQDVPEAAGVEGFTRTFVLKRLRPGAWPATKRPSRTVHRRGAHAGQPRALEHRARVHDFGMVSGEYFMTQEYIVGRDLGRLVSRYSEIEGGGLPEALAYYIAHETLQALAYAHDKRDKTGAPMGIVHRDVSAGNVMVSLLGEVKLSDFGIVKSNRRVTQTQVGMVKGNANFMSPEQARGQVVDHRSDLFSLAHVLFYCLTGRLLYTGDNDLDVLYRAATGMTAEDLDDIGKLPEPARGVLTQALAFDPAERFQSASEFGDALAAHTGGGKSATTRLMRDLFGDELQRQVAANVGAV